MPMMDIHFEYAEDSIIFYEMTPEVLCDIMDMDAILFVTILGHDGHSFTTRVFGTGSLDLVLRAVLCVHRACADAA